MMPASARIQLGLKSVFSVICSFLFLNFHVIRDEIDNLQISLEFFRDSPFPDLNYLCAGNYYLHGV